MRSAINAEVSIRFTRGSSEKQRLTNPTLDFTAMPPSLHPQIQASKRAVCVCKIAGFYPSESIFPVVKILCYEGQVVHLFIRIMVVLQINLVLVEWPNTLTTFYNNVSDVCS